MCSLKEAFTDTQDQSDFYNTQQTKYQEVEPNRILSNKIKTNLNPSIINKTMRNLSHYDPYTEKTTNKFSASGLAGILQGEAPTTEAEIQCRTYVGYNGLQQLIIDESSKINYPVRCGWRYKKSPGGVVAEVAQGALGTRNGPLNTNAPEDALGNGVQWIWNLEDAKKIYLRDITNALPTGQSLSLIPSIQNGSLTGELGYCVSSGRIIPIKNGKAAYPQDNTLRCADNNIITDVNKLPSQSQNVTSVQLQQNASLKGLLDCVHPGANSSLSRDCLLQAVKNNGCSPNGTLYQSLQMASPTSGSWDTYLKTQPSFQQYQSKQGGNAITENLFKKEQGSWDMAVNEINRLQKTTMTATDPNVRVASQDLCLQTGTYDNYDFCADITEGTSIGSVDIVCMQSYWQKHGGKPAGASYPNNKNEGLKSSLSSVKTWGDFKNAITLLKTNTNSSDGVVQRNALSNFYGVSVDTTAFSPLTSGSLQAWYDSMDGSTIQVDSDGGVISWNNKGSKKGQFGIQQTTKQNRPLYSHVGSSLPTIKFNEANQTALTIPNSFDLVRGYFTIFVVEQRQDSQTHHQMWFLGGAGDMGTNSSLQIGYFYSTLFVFDFWANNVSVNVESFKKGNEPYRIWSCDFNSSGKRLFLNGTLVASDTNNSQLNAWRGGGLGYNGGTYYTGNISEVMFYNPSVSDKARQEIEGYLANKWKLNEMLDGNHPFKNVAP